MVFIAMAALCACGEGARPDAAADADGGAALCEAGERVCRSEREVALCGDDRVAGSSIWGKGDKHHLTICLLRVGRMADCGTDVALSITYRRGDKAQ